jgi:outer membrane protein TolC
VEAQSAALEAQRSVIEIRTRQLDANVDLIRALGGGWGKGGPGSTAEAGLSVKG